MSITVGNVTTTTASVYSSSGNSAVTFLSLCNYSVGNVTATVHVVPSGDAASNLNMVLNQIPITTTDTYQMYAGGEKLLLEDGDSIQISATSDNALTAVVSYTAV